MKYQIGQNLYRVYPDPETGKVELDNYKVKTIRGGHVYAVMVIKNITWGVPRGPSKFTGEKWLEPISPIFRVKTKIDQKFYNLHTTKLKAYISARSVLRRQRKYYIPGLFYVLMQKIKTQITKLKKEHK